MEVYELMQIWFERIPCLKLLLRACLILFDFFFYQRKCSCVQRPLFVTVSGLVVLRYRSKKLPTSKNLGRPHFNESSKTVWPCLPVLVWVGAKEQRAPPAHFTSLAYFWYVNIVEMRDRNRAKY